MKEMNNDTLMINLSITVCIVGNGTGENTPHMCIFSRDTPIYVFHKIIGTNQL